MFFGLPACRAHEHSWGLEPGPTSEQRACLHPGSNPSVSVPNLPISECVQGSRLDQIRHISFCRFYTNDSRLTGSCWVVCAVWIFFVFHQYLRWVLCRVTTCVQIQGYQTEEKEKAQISGKNKYLLIYDWIPLWLQFFLKSKQTCFLHINLLQAVLTFAI